MSRGTGKVQRAVLLELTEVTQPLCAQELAVVVFGHATRSVYGCWPAGGQIRIAPAELASVKRALRRLEAKTGLVEARSAEATQKLTEPYSQVPPKGRRGLLTFWALKAVWKKLERGRRPSWRTQNLEAEAAAREERESSARQRTRLIGALRLLASPVDGERDAASIAVERLRKQIGHDWEILIRDPRDWELESWRQS
jgi:hypothetical protein